MYHKVTHLINKAMYYLSIESVNVLIITKSHSIAGISEGIRTSVHLMLNNDVFSDDRYFKRSLALGCQLDHLDGK